MKIDFVIPWVDGTDLEWINEKNKYLPEDQKKLSTSEERYRSWDNLQYWFRGVEKFAPWVNHIYFVTWGHIPKWLNVSHEKLVIVKHQDYTFEKVWSDNYNILDSVCCNKFRCTDDVN